MSDLLVDTAALRAQVRDKYREVATDPGAVYDFHTGRPLAARLVIRSRSSTRCPTRRWSRSPGSATRSRCARWSRASGWSTVRVSDRGRWSGWTSRRRATAPARSDHVESGRAWPSAAAADGWADVVISNGVINLCADKAAVFTEIRRVLRAGGRLQFADIANGKPVPVEAMRDIGLWTG